MSDVTARRIHLCCRGCSNRYRSERPLCVKMHAELRVALASHSYSELLIHKLKKRLDKNHLTRGHRVRPIRWTQEKKMRKGTVMKGVLSGFCELRGTVPAGNRSEPEDILDPASRFRGPCAAWVTFIMNVLRSCFQSQDLKCLALHMKVLFSHRTREAQSHSFNMSSYCCSDPAKPIIIQYVRRIQKAIQLKTTL